MSSKSCRGQWLWHTNHIKSSLIVFERYYFNPVLESVKFKSEFKRLPKWLVHTAVILSICVRPKLYRLNKWGRKKSEGSKVHAGAHLFVRGTNVTINLNRDASNRWFTHAKRRWSKWLKPSSLQRIPTLNRCWINHLHALSTIPEPIGKPSFWKCDTEWFKCAFK